MEFLYLFIGTVIGAIGGFLVSKKLSASEQDYQRLEQEVNESKSSLEQYQQEVAAHLDSSAQLLAKMNETCLTAMTQMEKSTFLLNKASTQSQTMPFFSKEAEAHLKAAKAPLRPKRRRQDESITEAPRDYSSDPSGLFTDKKQIVTNSPS